MNYPPPPPPSNYCPIAARRTTPGWAVPAETS
ncbi:hypothetical protein CEXT_344851, partial [Caerostris extrusa]